jgi:hypothetical protein
MEDLLSRVEVSSTMILISASLIVIGMILKNTPSIPNWIILWIVVVLGIIFNIFSSGLKVESVIEGVISAGLAITAHQTVKQTKEGILINRNKKLK